MNELVHRYSYIINSTHRSRQTGRARNVRGEPRYLSAGKGRTHVAITGRSLPLSRLMRQRHQLSCKLTIKATHSSVYSASRSQWMYPLPSHEQNICRLPKLWSTKRKKALVWRVSSAWHSFKRSALPPCSSKLVCERNRLQHVADSLFVPYRLWQPGSYLGLLFSMQIVPSVGFPNLPDADTALVDTSRFTGDTISVGVYVFEARDLRGGCSQTKQNVDVGRLRRFSRPDPTQPSLCIPRLRAGGAWRVRCGVVQARTRL